jgi:hypothetical protein
MNGTQVNVWILRVLASLAGLVSIRIAFAIERAIPQPAAQIEVPSGPPTAEDRLWQQKAEAARIAELETMRTAAKDWASTIAAVTGAIGVVSLVKGPDEIDSLTANWKIAAGVLIALAVLAALRGIVLAALGAQGSPRSYGYAPAAFRRRYRGETLIAARALQASRALVVLATLLAVAATGIVWFGTKAEKAESGRVLAVTTDGTTTCGVLGVAKGTITIAPVAGGTPTRIDPTKLRALIPTGKCP